GCDLGQLALSESDFIGLVVGDSKIQPDVGLPWIDCQGIGISLDGLAVLAHPRKDDPQIRERVDSRGYRGKGSFISLAGSIEVAFLLELDATGKGCFRLSHSGGVLNTGRSQ